MAYLRFNNVLALIPARGGSKGIPHKNIVMLAGKPLIYYSLKVAESSEYIDKFVVSTDDAEIAEIAEKYGAYVINRPSFLSEDDSSTIDVIKHTLDYLFKKENYIADIVVLLQPTSPLRNLETVNKAISVFSEKYNSYDSLVPVFPVKNKIGKIVDGYFRPNYILGMQRQKLENNYKECGTVFIFKTNMIKKDEGFGKKIMPFIIKNYKESIDVDTLDDLKKAEFYMGSK